MFKVGDRVVAIRSFDGNIKKGYAGKVVETRSCQICVEYDKYVSGHSCNGAGKYGHCWWADKKHFKLEEREFKVGDRVQFKSWEELKTERKEDEIGGLDVLDGRKGHYFNRRMKHLCGTFATIRSISKQFVELEDFTSMSNTDWGYSIDMIKLADEQPEKPEQAKKPKKIKQKISNSTISIDERKILISISKTYIARDIDGRLFAYQERPVIDIGGKQFYSSQPYKEILQRELFNFIKFTNSPLRIEDLIKEE